jgi:hypothetical protein
MSNEFPMTMVKSPFEWVRKFYAFKVIKLLVKDPGLICNITHFSQTDQTLFPRILTKLKHLMQHSKSNAEFSSIFCFKLSKLYEGTFFRLENHLEISV